ncbi:hypothetical protein DRN50_04415 [Thermococci archaeon]|nr:MAG: hypothetical protein DRN50_04415 [Thermococci archaeon]
MKKDILIGISLFLVAFVIRVAGVSSVSMYTDEWLYWIDTNRILASNFIPTREVFEYTNPFLSYIGALITLLFEGELKTLRIISVIFGSLTVSMLYLFGKVMYDRMTGLIAALFLCFSPYHSLYSRIFMLEALTLFFITLFLYFFWLSQCSEEWKKSTTYAIISGAMMGLAFDAKYISFFLFPGVLVYVLWTRRFDFKEILDTKIILTLIFAFLFFLPLLIILFYTGVGLNPIVYQSKERFEKVSVANIRVADIPLIELPVRVERSILDVFAHGAVVLSPPLKSIFFFSTISLFPITFLCYLPDFMRREKKSTFLIAPVLMLLVLLFGLPNKPYYMINLFPFYFIMLSHLTAKSFEHLKRNGCYRNILSVLIISLTVIMLFFYLITGSTSPFWDEGEYSWIKSGVEYIKNDIIRSGYEGRILIGTTTYSKAPVNYPIYFSDLNASTISILKPASKYSSELADIDLEKINILKPHYLIPSEEKYEYYFKESIKREIFKNYKIFFHSKMYPHRYYVLKRNMLNHQINLEGSPMSGKDGKISQDLFDGSVPNVMKVGKIYTVLVQVKNTGDSRTNFYVNVYSSDQYVVYVDGGGWCSIVLNRDSTGMLKFKIIPLREYAGDLSITADLYARFEDGTCGKVDSCSDYVVEIIK